MNGAMTPPSRRPRCSQKSNEEDSMTCLLSAIVVLFCSSIGGAKSEDLVWRYPPPFAHPPYYIRVEPAEHADLIET